MTRCEDRGPSPTGGVEPRDSDDHTRLAADVANRQISHDQGAERTQGLSSDKPGIDVSSEREAVEHVETGQTYAEDPRPKQATEQTEERPDSALDQS